MPNSPKKFLQISELYTSLQGEGLHSGLPCFFIRTAVCDIRCQWCDTPHALGKGHWMSKNELFAQLPQHIPLIQITGGEPLVQKENIIQLIQALLVTPKYKNQEKKVILETGGHRPLGGIPVKTHIVMDIKLSASGESHHDFGANLKYLKHSDEIKFVVQDQQDFIKACEWIREYNLEKVCNLLFSSVWGKLPLSKLAEWVLEANLQARIQTQLHKVIWGSDAKQV